MQYYKYVLIVCSVYNSAIILNKNNLLPVKEVTNELLGNWEKQ